MGTLAFGAAPLVVLAIGCTYICEPSLSVEAAHALADRHFMRVVGCGGVLREGVDMGNHWAFTVVAGYRPQVDPNPLYVDKRTGEMSWASDEIYRNPPPDTQH